MFECCSEVGIGEWEERSSLESPEKNAHPAAADACGGREDQGQVSPGNPGRLRRERGRYPQPGDIDQVHGDDEQSDSQQQPRLAFMRTKQEGEQGHSDVSYDQRPNNPWLASLAPS